MAAELIRTTLYKRRVARLLTEEEQMEMESHISVNPELCPVIPGTGGVRKARWGRSGGGKRGGVRVIYFCLPSPNVVLMLDVYSKREKEDLTHADKKAIRWAVEEFRRSLR